MRKLCINPRYTMTNLGPISWLLSIEVTRNHLALAAELHRLHSCLLQLHRHEAARYTHGSQRLILMPF